jgi:hypothetical protein
MLAQLGDLDPGGEGGGADARGEGLPCLGGGGEPTEPAEESRPLDKDPLLCPR